MVRNNAQTGVTNLGSGVVPICKSELLTDRLKSSGEDTARPGFCGPGARMSRVTPPARFAAKVGLSKSFFYLGFCDNRDQCFIHEGLPSTGHGEGIQGGQMGATPVSKTQSIPLLFQSSHTGSGDVSAARKPDLPFSTMIST